MRKVKECCSNSEECDRILVKRLQYVADDILRVLSDHSAYEGFSVSLQDRASGLSLMGKVVWCGQRM